MRTLIASLCLMGGAGCGTPQPIIVSPPPPPPWVMQTGCPWPAMPGEGRVTIEDAAAAVRDAKVAMADCEARLEGAQAYIRAVVKPE